MYILAIDMSLSFTETSSIYKKLLKLLTALFIFTKRIIRWLLGF